MDKDLILTNVARHISLEEDEKKFFLSLLESQSLKRKKLFLQAGNVCRSSALFVTGP